MREETETERKKSHEISSGVKKVISLIQWRKLRKINRMEEILKTLERWRQFLVALKEKKRGMNKTHISGRNECGVTTSTKVHG